LAFKPVTPNVILNEYQVGDTFRYSVCTGQFLRAGDPSPQCNKANAKSVSGGHNAPYVFSTGNSFLPPGVHLDANGVLSGVVTPEILDKPMFICVRQLNEQANCKGLGKFTGIQSIHNAGSTGAAKGGSGAGSTSQTPTASTGSSTGSMLLAGVAIAAGVGLAAAAAGGGGSSSSSSSSSFCLRWDCRNAGSSQAACTSVYGGNVSGTVPYSTLGACMAAKPNDAISSCSAC
jgi:hypothetical protein